MARDVNKIILVGNLGQDPELRYTGSGTAVCNLRLATTNTFTDESGNAQEKTEWHNVVVWGAQGEACNEYLSKGSKVYVEGSIQYREWEDKTGNTRYNTDIKAFTVNFLGSGQKRNGTPPSSEKGQTAYAAAANDGLPF